MKNWSDVAQAEMFHWQGNVGLFKLSHFHRLPSSLSDVSYDIQCVILDVMVTDAQMNRAMTLNKRMDFSGFERLR